MAGLSFDNVPVKRGNGLSFGEIPSRDRIVSRGGILPFSKQADGDVEFDSNAGLVGALKRAFMLPGEVAAGEVDPMSEEGLDRAAEMAAAVSPVNPAIRAGSRAVPGPSQALRRRKVKPPTAEALKAEAQTGYRGVRESGVDYKSDSVRDLAKAARSDLEEDGFFAPLTPKTNRLLRGLENPPADSIAPISQVAAARKAFGRVKRSPEYPEDFAASQRVRQRIADFIVEPPKEAVVDRASSRSLMGPGSSTAHDAARKAGRLQRESDGNYAAAKRSETLTGLRDSAELRAAVANSGQNLDNSTRQRLRALLENPRQSAGFDGSERAGIEKVARGTKGRNFLRGAGNVLGGGGGLGMMLTGSIGGGAGAMAGGPLGAAIGAALPTAAGAAMKGGAARLTQRGLRKVDEATRKRSPLYEQMVQQTPMEAIAPERRAALIRALLLQQAQAE